MSLQQIIEQMAKNAALEHQKDIRAKRIQYAADIYGYAASYDNAVIIAGFAAFFALWASTAGDIERFARLITVFLMGTSLMLYISWQIVQMVTRQKFEFEKADAFKFEDDPQRFNEVWADIERRHGIAQMQIIRLWPYIFLPTVAFGFAGGIVLAYNSLAAAFGWPQLTGHL